MTYGVAVEVRKNPKSTTWYNAVILDLKGESIRVGFEDCIWPNREVPAASVRRCPQEHSNDDFDPQVEEVVEVSVAASESNPSGWALGRVKTIKNSFYFIGFEGAAGTKAERDLIVERHALRRVNHEKAIDPASLERRLINVDEELQSWMSSQDSEGCLSHVQAKGHLLVAQRISDEHGGEPQVLLIGSKRAVDLGARLLVQIHFRNQIEIQRFHELLQTMKDRLLDQQQWYSSHCKETFVVEQYLVGKLIGKKGENIKLIREKHKVDVRCDDNEDGLKATVTITGQSDEAVKEAREELEYVVVSLPVESSQIGWILGRGFQNIQEIAKKTDLHHARFDKGSNSIELCGLRQQVEDAKLLINVHNDYLSVYKDMDEEKNTIQQSFEELDGAKARRKGGRGGGGGKGDKGDKSDYWNDGDKGEKGKNKKGDKGKNETGDKGGNGEKGKWDKGEKGVKGDKGKGEGEKGKAEKDDKGGCKGKDKDDDDRKGGGRSGGAGRGKGGENRKGGDKSGNANYEDGSYGYGDRRDEEGGKRRGGRKSGK